MSDKTEALEYAKKLFGMVPNLVRDMAEHNPTVATLYLAGNEQLGQGKLSQKEQQAVIVAISAKNDCHYCTAAHRTLGKAAGIPQEELDRLDRLEPPEDQRLKSLALAAWRVMDERGFLGEQDLKELEGMNVSRGELYEIVAILGVKTISNYINHIARTEIDEPFRAQATRGAP